MVKQLTLWGAWGRHSRFPILVARIVHSFLPSSDELFVEQRLRYFQEAETITEELEHNINGNYFTQLLVRFTDSDSEVANVLYQVTLLFDGLESIRQGRRVIKNLGVSLDSGSSELYIVKTIPLTESRNGENLRQVYDLMYRTGLEANIKWMKSVASGPHDEELFTCPLYDKDRLFIYRPAYKHHNTMRRNGSTVFYPTPCIDQLHLLL